MGGREEVEARDGGMEGCRREKREGRGVTHTHTHTHTHTNKCAADGRGTVDTLVVHENEFGSAVGHAVEPVVLASVWEAIVSLWR